MNVLFLGLGIVGQRHIRNIKLKYKKLNLYTLKSKHSRQLYSSNNAIKGNVKKKYNLNIVKLNEINKKVKIDAAFICLPNHLHTKYLKILVEKKIHVFLEKPGGINLSDYKDLIKIQKKIKKYNLKVMVGYHLRFHPIISKLKKIINDKSIGIILNVLVENGEHIADYRTYQKYWKRYHAKKKQGGGVLLNQIHEIDYLLDLFENYNFKVVNTFRRKMSNLKIDTEDTISSNFIVKKFKNVFLLSLLMNSYERPKKRTIKIIGTKGKVIFDFLKNEIEIYKFNIFKNGMIKSKKIYTKFLKYKINRNDLFKKEVYYFINAVKKNKLIDKKFGLKKSIKTLNIALQLNKQK